MHDSPQQLRVEEEQPVTAQVYELLYPVYRSEPELGELAVLMSDGGVGNAHNLGNVYYSHGLGSLGRAIPVEPLFTIALVDKDGDHWTEFHHRGELCFPQKLSQCRVSGLPDF